MPLFQVYTLTLIFSPLLLTLTYQIVEVTNIGLIFNATFGLIDNEPLKGFDWLMAQMASLCCEISGPLPIVLISDFDKKYEAGNEGPFPCHLWLLALSD